jgi:putative SOS response-associated peptidase YedK
MCGRFTLRTPTPVLIEHFRLGRIPPLPARFNIAPTQQIAAVRVGDAAARELAELHRMPVILSPGDYDLWLDPSVETREPLARLFHPYPSDEMTTTPVSTHVNSPRNDDPQCVVQQKTHF